MDPALPHRRAIGYLLRRAQRTHRAIFQVNIGDPNITPTQYSSMVKLNEYTELSQNFSAGSSAWTSTIRASCAG